MPGNVVLLLAATGAYPSCAGLAAAGAYGLARTVAEPPHSAPRQTLSRPAAGLCAVAYAFSGSVLFQYCNVVFLVGAAWLPWTLLATHRMLTERSARWALVIGMGLALTVLGGDPSRRTNGARGLYAVLVRGSMLRSPTLAGAERPLARHSRPGTRACWRSRGLAARCWPPSRLCRPGRGSRRSDRVVFTYPRSVYEIPAYLRRDRVPIVSPRRHSEPDRVPGMAGSRSRPVGQAAGIGTHRQAYGFSVAPWRLVEMLWPNVSGQTFPHNHRGLAAVGGEDAHLDSVVVPRRPAAVAGDQHVACASCRRARAVVLVDLLCWRSWAASAGTDWASWGSRCNTRSPTRPSASRWLNRSAGCTGS